MPTPSTNGGTSGARTTRSGGADHPGSSMTRSRPVGACGRLRRRPRVKTRGQGRVAEASGRATAGRGWAARGRGRRAPVPRRRRRILVAPLDEVDLSRQVVPLHQPDEVVDRAPCGRRGARRSPSGSRCSGIPVTLHARRRHRSPRSELKAPGEAGEPRVGAGHVNGSPPWNAAVPVNDRTISSDLGTCERTSRPSGVTSTSSSIRTPPQSGR